MSAARGVTAEELVRALKRRKAALPAEIGTFVALETCEALLARGPCAVSLASVLISDEALVRIEGAGPASEAESAQALHAMLTSLLVAAGPAPTPALMRLVEEGPTDGAWTLAQMRDDLEASLVPLNRQASRRVLARLVRETGWNERPSGRPQAPTFRELDAELSSLLGVPDEPAHDEEPARPERDRDATVREAVQAVDPRDDDVRYVDDSPSEPAKPAKKTPLAAEASASISFPSHPGQLRGLEGLDEPVRASSSRGLVIGIALVLLALGLVGVTLAMRPDALSKLSGGASEPAAPSEPKIVRKEVVGGDLVVRVSTERAQVLRFVGRGPVTVPHLPIGVAHEFVAIADGVAPTRVVVPKDAEWESTPEGPRYELAMQLGAPLPPSAPLDLGDTLLPQDVGSPRGGLGTVRIVTTPRGAKVYQLIGFAPETKVTDLPLDGTQELLVYRQGYAHVVRVIAPSDYVDSGDRKVADVSIELAPTKKR